MNTCAASIFVRFWIFRRPARSETGKKLDNKHYYHHTGWIGNLKDVKYRTLMNERPEFAMELAVKGMLPKNTIGRAAATRLKLYKGAEHNNAAQKPEAWTLD